jgi:hypothetical protein
LSALCQGIHFDEHNMKEAALGDMYAVNVSLYDIQILDIFALWTELAIAEHRI